MGPHFFKCGKPEHRVLLQEVINAVLQWGRTFSSAESLHIAPGAVQGRYTSMGPHFFKCGKMLTLNMIPSAIPHFNGAALFQVRKERDAEHNLLTKKLLQWGRTFSSAESPKRSDDRDVWLDDFNGAALFQVRKAGNACLSVHADMKHFNGAALFQVRKEVEVMR